MIIDISYENIFIKIWLKTHQKNITISKFIHGLLIAVMKSS